MHIIMISIGIVLGVFICGGCSEESNVLICRGCNAQFEIKRPKDKMWLNQDEIEIEYPKEISWQERSSHFLDHGELVWHSRSSETVTVGTQFQCPYCGAFMMAK